MTLDSENEKKNDSENVCTSTSFMNFAGSFSFRSILKCTTDCIYNGKCRVVLLCRIMDLSSVIYIYI